MILQFTLSSDESPLFLTREPSAFRPTDEGDGSEKGSTIYIDAAEFEVDESCEKITKMIEEALD
jgi:hypothetical protein